MKEKWRLAERFAYMGFIGASAATLFLWFYTSGGIYTPLVLGLKSGLSLFAFPFIGALLAALATLPFKEKSFGGSEGGFAAFVAFLAMCALVAFWGETGVGGFFAFSLFGFIFFGWALVAIGVGVGRRYRARLRNAL